LTKKAPLRMQVAAVFAILVLTGCTTSKVEKPLSDLAAYENQKLDWATCYEDFECTDLRVPIDYADLTVGTFKIAVLRYKAQDPKNRIGSLIVNPGGPGGSGVSLVDVISLDNFYITDNRMFGAEIKHFLHLRNATNH